MAKHAYLPASGSKQWLACPPSASLCAQVKDEGSSYAQEGSDAHALCEHLLLTALGRPSCDPTEDLGNYNLEMQEAAEGYRDFVMEQIAATGCGDPYVCVEQTLDFSKWVPHGFGTGDCVIIADGLLHIVDFKYGTGVLVSAERNSQLMCYALGALDTFGDLYDIRSVKLSIYQPRRSNDDTYNKHYTSKAYGGKIICGECGTPFGTKVWHSTDKYRKVILQCNNKFEGGCSTPHINEQDLHRWFSQAFSQYYAERDAITENMRFLRETCFDLNGIREKIAGVKAEMQTTADALRSCIEQNAAASITEEEYRTQCDSLHDRFQQLEQKHDKLSRKLSVAESDAAKLDEAIRVLETTEEIPMDFDPILWRTIVEKVLVEPDGTVTFIMVGGKEYKFTVY